MATSSKGTVSHLKDKTNTPHMSPSQGRKVLPKEVSFKVREKSSKKLLSPRIRASVDVSGGSFSVSSRVLSSSRRLTKIDEKLVRKSLPPSKDPDKRFEGKWISDYAEGLDAFLAEMEVSKKFKKLVQRHSGGPGAQIETLIITQKGDYFEITNQNIRRDICTIFEVGSSFKSENEKGEEVLCTALWEDESTKECLVIHAKKPAIDNQPTRRAQLKRWILPDGTMKQTTTVNGTEGSVTRIFTREG